MRESWDSAAWGGTCALWVHVVGTVLQWTISVSITPTLGLAGPLGRLRKKCVIHHKKISRRDLAKTSILKTEVRTMSHEAMFLGHETFSGQLLETRNAKARNFALHPTTGFSASLSPSPLVFVSYAPLTDTCTSDLLLFSPVSARCGEHIKRRRLCGRTRPSKRPSTRPTPQVAKEGGDLNSLPRLHWRARRACGLGPN